MTKKIIEVPFEVERAKRIQAGKEPGEIVTRDGCSVRVICWDRENEFYRIVALVRDAMDSTESIYSFRIDGTAYKNNPSEYDLVLRVPEQTQPKPKLEPFQKVLVRDGFKCMWKCALFSNYNSYKNKFPFICVGGIYANCIPYNDETKHLLGTTDDWEEQP